MIKKVLYYAAVALCLVIINNLAHSIYDLWQKQSVIAQYQAQLEAKEQQNKELKKDLAQAKTSQFLDQQARDKLFLTKPGEEQVIIPNDLLPHAKAVIATKPVPTWQQWVNLFVN